MKLPFFGRRPRAGRGRRSRPTRERGSGRAATRPAAAIRARRRPGATQARRPRAALRVRVARRLPRWSRIGAGLGLAATIAALAALAGGSWLRVSDITTLGAALTPASRLESALAPLRGQPLLTLDRHAVEDALASLPAIAEAHVETYLPDRVEVTVTEAAPAFVWQTTAVQMLCAADGTVIGQVARGADLPPHLVGLPYVDDLRAGSRDIRVGEAVPAAEVRTALRLEAIVPATLGSTADRLTVRIDEQYGFIVVAPDIGWSAAFGYYGLDPQEAEADIAARVERQAASVRTLFAEQPEASVAWVDARNPGRVYWRAKG